MAADRARSELFVVQEVANATLIRLTSTDKTNRLSRSLVLALTARLGLLGEDEHPKPLIITGNSQFFCVGADLNQIAALTAPAAFQFARAGQRLMQAVAEYPAAVFAAVEGHCM